jgi:WD40 repeat protein
MLHSFMDIDLNISSDHTVRLWNSATGAHTATLTEHTSRVWDIHATRRGDFIASAAADQTVKVGFEDLRMIVIIFQPLDIHCLCLSIAICYSGASIISLT